MLLTVIPKDESRKLSTEFFLTDRILCSCGEQAEKEKEEHILSNPSQRYCIIFFSRQVSACDLITSQRPRLVILTPFNYVPTHEHWLTREPHSNTNNTLWEGIANDNSLMNILVKNMGVGAKRVKHIQRNLTSTTLQAILPKQVRKVERIMAS